VLTFVDKGDAKPAAPPPPPPPPPVTGDRIRIELWVTSAILAIIMFSAALFHDSLPFSMFSQDRTEAEIAPLPHQLPYGKGMWMWMPEKSDGGDVKAMIARAKAVGLTHMYVRTGSSWDGFYAAPFLDELLPVAHAAGIRVYGWDFPRLIDPAADVERALAAINHVTPTKQRIDGFAADIETQSEGTHLTVESAVSYGDGLRAGVGAGYPLIACVPRPSSYNKTFYPFWDVVARFDAIAPMVYWLNRQPDSDAAGALQDLLPLGKPVFPVGQAYDGGPEGGRAGLPTPFELQQFMWASSFFGGQGVSFWSWQHADQATWDTIRDAPWFKDVPRQATAVKAAPPAKAGQPKALEAG
jgi:hypothetical protein